MTKFDLWVIRQSFLIKTLVLMTWFVGAFVYVTVEETYWLAREILL